MPAVRVLAFTCCIVLASAIGATEPRPRPDDTDVERLIDRIDRSRSHPPLGDVELKPTADPTRPAAQLRRIIADLETLSAGHRGPKRFGQHTRDPVRVATHRFRRALAVRTATDPDLDRVLTLVRRGVAALALPKRDPRARRAASIRYLAAALARDIADTAVGAARRGGHRAEVARAAAFIGQGDRALRARQPLFAIAQFQRGFGLAADVISFHPDVFQQNIRDALAGQAIGWQYTIGLSGSFFDSDFGGDARTSADGGPLPQSPQKEMYIASMTKTLTAVAMQRVLAAEGISVDDTIGPYLPSAWTTRGDGVDDITFRQLMTHRSGLDPNNIASCCSAANQDLATMQAVVAADAQGGGDNTPSNYTNANYSLMRVLIPQIDIGEAVIANYANIWPLDAIYAGLYADYVNRFVLAPAGIDKDGCFSSEPVNERTLLYSLNTPNANGMDPGDWSLACGATGWYLSSRELASFLGFLRFTDDILTPTVREQMDAGLLGWLDDAVFSGWIEGDRGLYRSHGGDYPGLSNPGMTGCMMNFDTNFQIALLVSSRGGDLGGHACQLLRDAYDAAWL